MAAIAVNRIPRPVLARLWPVWLALLQGLRLGYGGDDIGWSRLALTFRLVRAPVLAFGLFPHACEFSLAIAFGLQLLFALPSPL